MNSKLSKVTAILLCGGVGSRLWPISHKDYPKPFVEIKGSKTLFQETLSRIQTIDGISTCCIVGSQRNKDLIVSQMQSFFPTKNGVNPLVLLESEAKNTAGSLTLACLTMESITDDDEVVVVLPADHEILNIEKFVECIESAIRKVSTDNSIVIIGTRPVTPAVDYGYIKADRSFVEVGGSLNVSSFHEKPTEDIAKYYYESGEYFWNCGIYVLRKKLWLDSIKKYSNEIYISAKDAFLKSWEESIFKYFETKELVSNSIDYAVIEKIVEKEVGILKVLPANDLQWSDLGTWQSIKKNLQLNSKQNIFIGEVYGVDTTNVFVKNNGKPLILLGVKDLIVINTDSGVFVTTDESVKDINKITQNENFPKITPSITKRPWGSYRNIERKDNYLIKKICIKPGAFISLQKHEHRDEYWTIIKGSGLLEIGGREKNVSIGDQIIVKKKELHRIGNVGQDNLEIIEIQMGEIISEEDITRYKDDYGRSNQA
jgi:mannose-1-phosphate guanylyltransferase/mannose-6-phosphate isomerase